MSTQTTNTDISAAFANLKVTEDGSRSKLGEGRSYGIAFAICKRNGDVLVETGPKSPCREYLNDQLFSELSGEPYGAYGYKSKKEGVLEDDMFYISMAVLPQFGKWGSTTSYPNQGRDIKSLADNHKNIQSLLNQYEEMLKLPDRTTIFKVSDNLYVCAAPKWWAQWTYLVSLYTLIIRVALEAEYKSGDIFELFQNANTTDVYYTKGVIPKMKALVEGKMPKQDLKSGGWHTKGIVNQSF